MPHIDFKLDGKKIPSVTTILEVVGKPYLYKWYGTKGWARADAIKRGAGTRGSAVHDLIEQYYKSGTQPEHRNKNTLYAARSILNFANKNQLEPVKNADGSFQLETHVVFEKWKYHGTFDAIATAWQKGPFVVDWKTSNHVDIGYRWQLAAYAAAWNDMHKLDWKTGINAGLLVRTDKKNPWTAEPRLYENLEYHFEGFLELLDIYNRIKEANRDEYATKKIMKQ